jgi:hypothetical protein
VHDHDDAPDAEADRVQAEQQSAAVPNDEQRDSASEERQGRGDEQRSKHPQQEAWCPGVYEAT